MRFIVSTIGTSSLTNSIKRNKAQEGDWRSILGITANATEKELSEEHKNVIDTLAERVRNKLDQNDAGIHRQTSAELNGIYAIYEGTLPQNTQDQHYLICTDTFQGRTTGKLIKKFLKEQGFSAVIEIPTGLSTKDTDSFTDGTKALIKWLEDNVPWRRDAGYQVIFNLVGGFKSLQGYMQTFGTFYADETVYIFEGSSDLIKIPRLPIQIDTTVIQEYRGQFAMMEAKAPCPINTVPGVENISRTLWDTFEDGGATYVGLSAWGMLLWNRTKDDFLENDTKVIKKYGVQFALMDAGKSYQETDVTIQDIPAALLEYDGTNVKMSTWGQSVWDYTKGKLLSNVPLLEFPRLQYHATFSEDIRSYENKLLDLQTTLANISVVLQNTGGNTSPNNLNKNLSGMNFKQLQGHANICTFRINQNFRVSYEVNNGNLILRRYGTHDNVYNNP